MEFWRIKTYLLCIRCKMRRSQSELFYRKRICLFGPCKNVVLLTRTWWLKNCQITLTIRYFLLTFFLITIIIIYFSDFSIKKMLYEERVKKIHSNYSLIKLFDTDTVFLNTYFFGVSNILFLCITFDSSKRWQYLKKI